MAKELSKQYDPVLVEDATYRFWQEGGFFEAAPDPDKKPYCIVMPPPNITGQLHMGHALDNALQDLLIRWRRMQGFEALWVPGTDHASIATEAKIVEAMRAEGITKDDLGREGFLKRAWEWRNTYGGKIVDQLKKLGSSCDWSRERFTMDEGCSKAVLEFFVRLYEKGLIYRGERIINWCPKCLTSISDAEVEYDEKQGHFYHIKYPLADGGGFVEIATTRPETMLGDTAVAVHPDDERFRHLVGKTLILPLMDREIPIIADEYVEPEFGTGCVKMTPAHDPNDFEVGLRHGLEIINVMNDDATINENGGKYRGLTREAAREAVVKDLEAGGYLLNIKEHVHNVGSCYRCGKVVEPRVSMQWFVKMKPLATPAIDAVKTGETSFIPERFTKIYMHWMENIKDWCISRQLWWGHRIPAWYDEDGNIYVARSLEEAQAKAPGKTLARDPDTLDTWFSSGLWPFSTLGWPDRTPELEYFYPTSTLVTGYDIIFFWVARMIFSGVETMEKSPFANVFVHGIIRDAQGRKMSKSLGNGIDPLEIIALYGADALRFALCTGVSPGNDMRFSDEKVKSARNFANKVWNATRFALMNLPEDFEPGLPLGYGTGNTAFRAQEKNNAQDKTRNVSSFKLEDMWAISKYNQVVKEVTDNLEKFELGVALQKLYDFIWDILCDWYIELTKTRVNQGGETAESAQRVLMHMLDGTLRLLHPFMPFITEELWQAIPHEGETLMRAAWPVYDPALSFEREEKQFSAVMDVIRGVRQRRSEMNVPPSKKAKLFITTEYAGVFAQAVPFLQRLAFASEVEIEAGFEPESAVQVVTSEARVFIPLSELVDTEKELARLKKEKEATEKEIAMLKAKLGNAGFTAKAPASVVEGEREKLTRAEEKLLKIEESLKAL